MHRTLISAMKEASLDMALDKRINVLNTEKLKVGSLVPVGEWILHDEMTLEKVTSWRRRFNRMFPTRNSVTIETTRRFIAKSYIQNPDSLLFMILTNSDEIIGHIGICGLDDNNFEIVNLVRGMSGGDDQLIYFAEVSLLNFGFALGDHGGCFVEIMSYNWVVADLHKRVGFVESGSIPLQKQENSNGITHKRVKDIDKNVDYTIECMTMSRGDFAKIPN